MTNNEETCSEQYLEAKDGAGLSLTYTYKSFNRKQPSK